MDEADSRIEQAEIDYFGLHVTDEVVRVDGHRIPASLPYGVPSWETWWPKWKRPAWIKERIRPRRVDQLPDTQEGIWSLFVAGVLRAHGYDGYVEHDPLQVLPVVRDAITVRQCEGPDCENVIQIISTSNPELRDLLSDIWLLVLAKPQTRYCADPECKKRRDRERQAESRHHRIDVTKSPSMGERAFSPEVHPTGREEELTRAEELDARISRLEELLRLQLESTLETAEKIRKRLPDDPRISAAVDELMARTQPKQDVEATRPGGLVCVHVRRGNA